MSTKQGNISCHWCERTNMFAKLKIFVKCCQNIMKVKKQT